MTDSTVFNFNDRYNNWLKKQQRKFGRDNDRAMSEAIGGEFQAFGTIERELLYQHGLQDSHFVIDVGCGSGRLSHALAKTFAGRYLGTDVVPELLEYAKKITQNPGWRFELTTGLAIPERDACANVVCFFSVMTHLRHEESYRYLQEAKRVLVPGGLVILSFLEFRVPSHWSVFEGMLRSLGTERHLDMFLAREMMDVWCRHLGLEVVAYHDGDKPHIPIKAPIHIKTWNKTLEGMAHLGQSVAVLRRSLAS